MNRPGGRTTFFEYTARGNLVAVVVTAGTAVFSLGNIGALTGKPAMEGKSKLGEIHAHTSLDEGTLREG